MCDAPNGEPTFDGPLSLVDRLDLAQSQLDDAEQLFCSGHADAAQRAIDRAVRILGGQ